jgi:ATP-dependent Clp protease protease subunit
LTQLMERRENPFAPMSTRHNGRVLYLSGDINEHVASEINIEMIKMQREDPLQDITIIVDSYGGDLFAAFAIVDVMEMLTCDIKTICVGKAMSAGQFIFSTGAKGKRLMSKHARLMLHNPQAGMEGSVPDIEVELEELQKCRDLFINHIGEKSGNSYAEIKEMINRNKYLDATEAIAHGFADGIIHRLK